MKMIDRTVSGTVVNTAGAVITDYVGSAYVRTADNKNRVAAPVVDGVFTIKFSSSDIPGNNLLLGAIANPGSGYSGANETTVKLAGTSATKNVTAKVYDASIAGSLLLPTGTIVTNPGSDVTVYGVNDNGDFTSTVVGDDGSYSLAVAAGTWYVNYDIADPTETTNLLDRPIGEDKVTVKAGQAITKHLTVTRGSNTITGTVRDADGTVVQRAKVTADNRAALENNSNANPNAVVTTTVETDESGVYMLKVPDGTYMVTIGDTPAVPSTQLQPDGKSIKVASAATVTANFAFENSDATIAGTVKLGKNNEGGGTITAWTADGGKTTTTVDTTGKYTLHVTSGETWKVVATDTAGSALAESNSQTIRPKKGSNTQNLALVDTGQKVYGPVTKSFDAADPASVSLPDGTTVSVPERALDISGTVSLTVTPTVEIDQTAGDVSASLAYEVKATDADGYELARLNAPATITIPYQDKNVGAAGLREKTLGTNFYNSETDQWENTPGFVDTTKNVAKLTTTHLTKFSITGTTKDLPKITKVTQQSLSKTTLVLKVIGTNFTGKPTATVGGIKASKVEIRNATMLLITVPTAKFKAGTMDLVITNGNGRTVTKAKFVTLIKRGATLVPSF